MKTSMLALRSAARLCAINFLALLLSAPSAWAAFEVSWPDARSAAMLARGGDFLPPLDVGPLRSSTGSATESGTRRGRWVTVSAGELYGVREAAGWGARAAARFRGASVGVELSALGSELYQERSLGLRVGLDPDSDLHLATTARVLGLSARGVDDRWTVAVDASVTRRLIGRVLLGAACENLTRSRIGDSPVATRTRFGGALVLPSLVFGWSLLLEEAYAPSTVLSFETALTDWLCLRAGARDAPGKLGFGIGVGRRSGGPWPAVDLAWQWHPELGVSSFVSISIVP